MKRTNRTVGAGFVVMSLVAAILVAGCGNVRVTVTRPGDDGAEEQTAVVRDTSTDTVETAEPTPSPTEEYSQPPAEDSAASSPTAVAHEGEDPGPDTEAQLAGVKAEELPEEPAAEPAVSDRERSHALNGLAFALYQERRFEEAAAAFKDAIAADETYYLPRFNYACTVAILIREDAPTWYYMEDEVISQLAAVLELNPDYIDKVKSDSDLDAVRKNFHYLEVIGVSPNTADGTREVLTNLDWYVPGEGIFAYFGGAEFADDGTVELWFYTPDWFESFDDEDRYRVQGNYTTAPGEVTITVEEPMIRKRSTQDIHGNASEQDPSTVFRGTLNTDGTISIEGFEYKLNWTYDKFSA